MYIKTNDQNDIHSPLLFPAKSGALLKRVAVRFCFSNVSIITCKDLHLPSVLHA